MIRARPRLIQENILAAVGNTPLVRLGRYRPDAGVNLFAKLEMLNPGGSIKDRPATTILEEALRSGAINPGTTIVESSSGNMGIGLAQACRYHGLRFICVVDPRTAEQNLQLLRVYGAEINRVTKPDPVTGEFLQARIDRVRALLQEIEGSFWPNQYENPHNPRAHYSTTMREIADSLDGRVDYLFVATSTCGTIRGCAEYAQDFGLRTRIVAVDAVGSLIFSNVSAKRMVPGLGAGIRPPLCEPALIDECVHVSDLDCVAGCRRLVAREAILAGGSSGGVLSAIEKKLPRLPAGSNCVAILPDRGERYLDTIYSDDWVLRHFGHVDPSWQQSAHEVLDWQTVFQTSDRGEVEAHCRRNGIETEWKDGNRLRTRAVRPAMTKHPRTGEFLWFNHATFFHVSTLVPEVREDLLGEFAEEDLPANTYYGDGTPIEPKVLDHRRAAYHAETVVFPWQQVSSLGLLRGGCTRSAALNFGVFGQLPACQGSAGAARCAATPLTGQDLAMGSWVFRAAGRLGVPACAVAAHSVAAATKYRETGQQGDLLLLDNMMVAHARAPYAGARKVLVGMAEPVSWEQV